MVVTTAVGQINFGGRGVYFNATSSDLAQRYTITKERRRNRKVNRACLNCIAIISPVFDARARPSGSRSSGNSWGAWPPGDYDLATAIHTGDQKGFQPNKNKPGVIISYTHCY
jgi:hypothetical protein